jgi:hypothetical protein
MQTMTRLDLDPDPYIYTAYLNSGRLRYREHMDKQMTRIKRSVAHAYAQRWGPILVQLLEELRVKHRVREGKFIRDTCCIMFSVNTRRVLYYIKSRVLIIHAPLDTRYHIEGIAHAKVEREMRKLLIPPSHSAFTDPDKIGDM